MARAHPLASREAGTAARDLPEIPARLSLRTLRRRAAGCRACPLYLRGTQTVFGAGPSGAKIVLVGEQPGDREDRTGEPFVGPAGKLLDRALLAAGIDRTQVYVTNAVKHFKWRAAGKRRLHQKPSSSEIAACRPWLAAELAVLAPDIVVALGATAAQALMGADFRVTRERGRARPAPWAKAFFATVHPSAILRQSGDAREEGFAQLVADLRRSVRHDAFPASARKAPPAPAA